MLSGTDESLSLLAIYFASSTTYIRHRHKLSRRQNVSDDRISLQHCRGIMFLMDGAVYTTNKCRPTPPITLLGEHRTNSKVEKEKVEAQVQSAALSFFLRRPI